MSFTEIRTTYHLIYSLVAYDPLDQGILARISVEVYGLVVHLFDSSSKGLGLESQAAQKSFGK